MDPSSKGCDSFQGSGGQRCRGPCCIAFPAVTRGENGSKGVCDIGVTFFADSRTARIRQCPHNAQHTARFDVALGGIY